MTVPFSSCTVYIQVFVGVCVPAVDKHRAHLGCLCCRRFPDEGKHGQCVLRYAHVRPLRVVILDYCSLALTTLYAALLTLHTHTHNY